MINSPTFMISVIVDTDSGMKLLKTIASAAPLPTDTWLGSIKKNTAAATMTVPTVMMANSLTVFRIFMIPTSLFVKSSVIILYFLQMSNIL